MHSSKGYQLVWRARGTPRAAAVASGTTGHRGAEGIWQGKGAGKEQPPERLSHTQDALSIQYSCPN